MADLLKLLQKDKGKEGNTVANLLGVKPSEGFNPAKAKFPVIPEPIQIPPLPSITDISKGNLLNTQALTERTTRPARQTSFTEQAEARRGVFGDVAQSSEDIRRSKAEASADELLELRTPFPKITAEERDAISSKLGIEKQADFLESFGTGLAGSVPGLNVEDERRATEVEQRVPTLFTIPEKVPLIGGADVKPSTLGAVAGNVGLTALQYGVVSKALGALGTTSKIAQLMGKSKLAKFGAEQTVDLLADVIIQTPGEALEALANDNTLGEFGSIWARNRAIDAAMNLVIGGTLSAPQAVKARKALKADAKLRKAADDAIKKLPIEKRVEVYKELGLEVPLGPQVTETLAKTADDLGPTLKSSDLGPLQGDVDKAFRDFQDWRKRNFGGAAGKVADDEFQALKDMYKQDTGIDLDNITETVTQVGRRNKVAELLNVDTTKGIQAPVDLPNLRPGLQTPPLRPEISPRTPDIPTPVVGTSKAPLLDRVGQRLKETAFGDTEVNTLRKEFNRIDKELPTTSNLARTEVAQKVVDDNLEVALRMVKEGEQFGSRVEQEVGRLLLPKLAEQGRHKDYVEVVEAVAKKRRSASQDLQSSTLWKDLTPEGAAYWATETLKEAGVKVDPSVINTLRKDMEVLQTATKEQLAKEIVDKVNPKNSKIKNALLGNLEKNIDSLGFAKLQDINRAIAMEKVLKKIPKIKAKKLSSIQAISHLLNTRTFIRNIVGNTASIGIEFLNRPAASLVDRTVGAFTKNRTIVNEMPKFLQSAKKGWDAGKKNFFEIVTSPNNRQINSKYEKLFESAFSSKPGKALEKTLQVSLQTPDEFFKAFYKVDSLYNQVRGRLGKDVKNMSFDEVLEKATKTEIDTAIKEAEFVTFQNDSWLAEAMSDTKKLLNRVSSNIPGKMFTEDFGLGDMLIKYTRVPGNIITRGFEYSPLGGIKAVYDLFKLASTKGIDRAAQRQLSQSIGRGLTGTGLILTGGALASKGIITPTPNSTDYNRQAFDKAQGAGGYKINMSALARFITGKDPTPQPGDTLRDFKSLQPFNVPLAVGARISQEGGLFKTSFSDLTDATWEEAVDLPTLFVVKQMFYESMDKDNNWKDVMSVPLKESLSGFVPSIARQIAQIVDPTIRETSGGATGTVGKLLNQIIGEKAAGKIQANIPGLSKGLEPKLDVFGQEQIRDSDLFGSRVAGTLFDPGFKTEFTPKAYNDKINLVAELSGASNFFPDRKAPNTTTVDGVQYRLTPEQKTEWQRVEGQEYDRLLTEYFDGMDDEFIRNNAFEVKKDLEDLKKEASSMAKEQFIIKVVE